MFQNESTVFKSPKNILKSVLLFLIAVFASSLLFSACASLGNPSGGEKDFAPPIILSSFPENKSTQVQPKKIVFTFDELVNVKNPEDQIIVSPAIENVEFKIKGKKLEVIPKDTLLKNTTYAINLNSAVVDITEENKIEPYQFIFSTGTAIDSLKLSGSIVDAQTKDPLSGFCVGLFPESIPFDSIPNRKASIYTYTDAKGDFIVYGLKKQGYQIIAFKDQNKNKQVDLSSEAIASSFHPIDLENDTVLLPLQAFEQTPGKLQVKDKKLEGDKGLILLNKAYEKITLQSLDTHAVLYRINSRNDSIDIYSKRLIRDTLKVVLLANAIPFDTLFIRQKKASADSTAAFINPLKSSIINPGNYPLFLESGFPIQFINKDSISLYEDSLLAKAVIDTSFSGLRMLYDWKEGKKYKLVINTAAVGLYNGALTAKKSISFSVDLAENLGNLLLLVKNKENKSIIIQLLTEKKEVLAEQTSSSSETITFSNLKPGKYLLRYVIDDTKNGHWDTGSFQDKKTPESIIYYKDVLNVRANWELELDLPILP